MQSIRVRIRGLFVATLCVALSACVSNLDLTGPSLEERLSGQTIEFEGPEGLPSTRTTYHADGTTSYTFRPYFVPERLAKGTGYWWVERGRYCSSANPPSETNDGSCYNVSINGNRVLFKPYSPPTLIRVLPEFRKSREGRFV